MNNYKIDILAKKDNDYEIVFSFPIKAQNKEEARNSILRNDVQSVIKANLPSNIKRTIKIHIWFDNRLIYELEQDYLQN